MKEVFRETIELESKKETILVIVGDWGFDTITKEEFKDNLFPTYRYCRNEFYAYSNVDVDIYEALKNSMGLPANVPEDFYFNHP